MKKSLLLILLLAVTFTGRLLAQSSTANYVFSPTTTGSLALDMNGNAVDMTTGTTTLLGATTDDTQSPLTGIPFDIWFMGTRYNSFGATDNGLIVLGGLPPTNGYILANGTSPTLAPFANDMRLGTDGVLRYKIIGTAPNRVCVVEWNNVMIRYLGTAAAGTATFQARFYETTGVIEYVYGTMTTNSATTNLYYVGFSTSSAVNNILTVNTTTLVTSTTTSLSNAYTASSTITALNSAADGVRVDYKFTPPVPNAPSGLTVTPGVTSALLNWTDNSTNEQGFVVYSSTDGINYTFLTQTAANATSVMALGLSGTTTYFFKVYAVSEGALSTPASGSTTTTVCSFTGTKTVGPTGDFATIQAAANYVLMNGLVGPAVIELQTGYVATGETFPVVINAIPCASATNTVTIRPQGTMTISASNATALFDFNGANYVVIDGRVGSTGSTSALTISNTNTSGATVRFINDASNNALMYNTLMGVETSTTSGVVFFSTTNATTGNDNNFIGNNTIMDGTSNPFNCIYSSGTTGKENDHNTVANNNIANFFSAGSASNGIFLTSGNTDWTITSNKIYQTALRTYTSANTHRGIQVNNTGGNNFSVTNNTIGFASSTGTGTYTMTGTIGTSFQGILMTVGTTTLSSVQGNTISGFNLSGSTGSFVGIAVTGGTVNVGNLTANTIGSTTAVDAIVKTNSSTTNPALMGVNVSGGTVLVQNNNIGGLTTIGSATIGAGVHGIVASSGTVTISGNMIGSATVANSINASSATSGTQTVYGVNGSTGTAITVTGNTIANVNNNGTATNALTAGVLYSSSATNAAITSNIIHDVYGATASTTITGQEGVCGIAFTGSATTPVISLNTIYAIGATNTGSVASNAAGIGITSATSAMITRNTIYDIRNASTGTTATAPPTADGIVVGNITTDITVANNMVSLGNLQTTNTSFNGILQSANTSGTVKIYYNTVNIEGSPAAGALASAGIHRGNFSTTAITSTVDIKNNISVNKRIGGTSKNYAIANGINVVTSSATGWASNASNFNIWNDSVAANLGYWSGDQTFATWQAASLSDGNSYGNTSVIFVNSTTGNLHLNMGIVANNIESHGVAIAGLTTDFDNDTRPGPIGSVNGGGTGPDIGADEFDGTLVDNIPPTITYASLNNTCLVTDRTITATIADASGIPAAGSGTEPRLYFRKNTGAYTSVAGTLSSGTLLSGVWSFTIPAATLGTLTGGDHVFYYVAAQDVFGNVGASPSAGFAATNVNTVVTPPVAPSFYSILPGSGTYTVGVGGNYTTITEAVNAYDSACLTGPIVFNLTDAAYLTETYPLTIINNTGASATNTLTIKPATGVAVTFASTAVAPAIFKLIDARFVTIDGLNTGGSSMSITNPNTGTSAGVWLASNTTGNNTVAIKNMTIIGGGTTSTSIWSVLSGINGATPSSTAGADNDNITVQGNTFLTCGYGVYGQGTAGASAGGLDNWTITGNTFGPSATGATIIGYNGLFMNNGLNFNISNNIFRNIGTNTLTSQSCGINLSSNVTGFTIAGNNISNVLSSASTGNTNSTAGITLGNAVVNGTITGNYIAGIYNYNTSGYASRGIILNSGMATSNIVVANNMITNIVATSDAGISWWNAGIDLEGSMGGVQIYDNTVALTGSFAGYASSSGSAALMINSGVTHINVRDNIFLNSYDNTSSTTDKGWAIYSAASATAYDTIDYNDYYAAAPDVLAYLGGDRTSLAAIQTAFGGNTHSVTFSPVFVSSTDAHLQPVGANAPLYAGTPISSVTTDINGTTRGLVTTIIGAHEAALPVCGTVVGGTATPITPSLCVSGTTTISLTGATAAIGIGVQWYSSTDSVTFTPITGATGTSYTIAPAITATTYYRAVSTCSFTANSDSASTSVHVYGLPTIAVTPDGGTICTGTSGITLTASGAVTYSWTPTASLSAAVGATVTATPAVTTAYVVTGTDAHGCANTHTSTVIVNFTPAAITFSPALPALCVGSSVSVTATANVSGPSTALTQNFNSGLGAWVVDNTGTTDFDSYAPWQIQVDGYVSPEGDTYHSPDNSQFVSTNSDHNGSGTTDVTKLVSPSFSLVNYTVATLSFDQYYRLYSGDVNITVDVSTDGGTTWGVLHNYLGTSIGGLTSFASASLDLSAYLGQPSVKLRWNYQSSYGYYWAIDNVSVAGTLSTPASNVTWSPSTGLFTDALLTVPYAGTAATTVYAAPAATTPYTVTAVNAGCSTTGNVTVTVNPLPLVYAVTGGAHYCAGGTGVAVGLANSETGVNYQLFNGATAIGTAMAGTTGTAVNFGLQTTAGTYTVVATNATTGCTSNMTGTATVTIDALPIAYTVTGGGFYCAGGTGIAVGVANSETGVNYQLFNGATAVGSAVAGTTGSAISFGLQTAAGTYTVQATNGTTTCTNPMTGSVTITINPLPAAFTVTGGGSYCAGGTGMVVGLGNSDLGFSYQLYNGVTAVGAPVAGTGAAISFGLQTGAGTYTVTSTNTGTTCTATMTGSATITIDPLPTAFAVTGGGSYCTGGTGVVVGLANSTTGVSYQLFNGATAVGTAVAGTTGSSITFGLQTAAGTYTVQATNGTTTCTSTMTGSVTVTINPLPTAFAVTGGGGYCPSGTGVAVGLFTSTTGVNYQLFVGTTAVGSPVAGTGAAISFGLQTTVGTYTVVATNATTSCTSNMTGSITVSINPAPLVYNVTGGGGYCAGGTGVTIDLSNSETGVNYQLYNGSTPVGTAVAGTGATFSFGLQTTAGTYAVVATNATTGCTSNMNGFPTITVTPLPTVYTVTGGGAYCIGGTGVAIGLSNSETGITYQLYNGATAVGIPVSGTSGAAISFGLQTAAGTYTVVANNSVTTCSVTMTGSATITISALPTAYAVTGGGAYCAGGSGMAVGLLNSTSGVSYQLYNGATAVGTAVAGTGGAISFGLQTAAGTYTVVATNTTTTCTNNMTGSVSITINPLPTAYTVTGGGGYCTGGTGVTIGLTNSETGVTYQLYNGTTAVGTPVTGVTGLGLSFGLQTAAGTYNVVATNTGTSCTVSMTGTVTVTINPLPTAYVVTGGGSYCTGGAGVVVGLFNSTTGVSYQLYNGATAVGTAVAGTGSSISFGLQTAAGTYTVVATNTTTTCTNNMTGSVTITISPLPIATYTVTGGGSYCAAGAGMAVGLSNSETGVNYQLYVGTTAVGTPVAGTGAAISFGLQTAAGTYTVVAINATTACTSNMTGSVTITIIPLPATYTVTGGGAYCTGGTGVVVGLSNSETGITYQLYNGATAVGTPVSGTSGSAISFGLQTAAGTYTVVANNSVTTCSVTMTGSATITISALPTAYAVTGGGAYCAGGTGVVVGLFNSTTGVTYQLYNGTTAVGTPVSGTGAAISFGLQTAAGIYTVVATNTTTTCTSNMTGSVSITINPLPVATYSVTGGGAYCSGGTGAVVGLSNSDAGINYQLFVGTSSAGVAVAGTGAAISFGLQTVAGTYTVVATDAITGCTSNMTGSVTITITTPVTVSVTLSAGVSDTVCLGSTVTITATAVNGGTTPTYVWSVNGVAVTATGATYSYVPTSGDIVSTVLTSSAACVVSPTATDSITITTAANVTPLVAIVASPDTAVCAGSAITFTASPTFGGTAPTYSWIVNGTVVGLGATYTYIPADGDVVVALMHSNFPCRTIDSAFSNTFTIEVNPVLTPLVTITATPGTTIGVGANDTLTAGIISGGTSPTYQWYVNGVAISGATNATYISTFTDNDSVSVVVVSSLPCTAAASNHVIIHVTNDVKDVTLGNAHISLMPNPNNGTFNVKGTLGTSADANVSIEVTDMLGQVVYRQQVIVRNGEVNEMVQLDGIVANGTYLLNFRSGTHNAQFHFILNR